MQNSSYRFLVISFMIFLTLTACMEKPSEPPILNIISESGFTYDNRTVAVSMPLKIGVTGSATGASITNLSITMTTENGTETALDSGLYANSVRLVKEISYGASAFEKWTFTAMDKNRNRSSVSITLTKDPNSIFGQIKHFPSLKLGCQQNSSAGSFMDPKTGTVYFASSADSVQAKVCLLLYYASLNSPPTDFTLSSPGETEVTTYYPQINEWTLPRTEVRYKSDSLSITPQQFDVAYNDSLIISNYTSATVGKRKFKSVRAGYVIPFQITAGDMSGKRGLLKIISVSGQEQGLVQFAMKIQN